MTVTSHKRLLLVVIDGLGAATLRDALAGGHAPNLQRLIDGGAVLDDAISPFPSLTPVCLSTIATGTGPDRHRIPSLGWYHRGERRFVEYGSSFQAAAVEGHRQTIEDVILNLNHLHLAEHPLTLFEVFHDHGRPAAAVNFLVYRGRTRHTMKHAYGPLRQVAERVRVHAVYGPEYFSLGELYGSDGPLLPQLGIKRPRDWGAAHVARWLLRNTPAEFLLLYLGAHDSASHRRGPGETQRAIRLADRAVARAIDAMGGIDQFIEECALVLCADHGQTAVDPGHYERLADVFDDVRLFHGSRDSDVDRCDLALVPSNRFAMAYRLHHDSPTARWTAERLQESAAVDIVAFREGEELVARRGDLELRFVPDPHAGVPTARAAHTGEGSDSWQLTGDLEALDLALADGIVRCGAYPDALHRLASALACVNSGEVLVSGAVGWEFLDIGGGSHPGGSHGSLHAIDSTAPLLTVGLDGATPDGLPLVRLADIAGMVTSHFGLPHPDGTAQ